jgi:isoleucyl-tRNA synthetase
LTDWPALVELPVDAALVAAMDRVREVCSAASSIRKAQGLPVRHPLPTLTVATADAQALEPFTSLIADEVNVKDVVLTTDVAAAGRFVLQLVPAVLGPRVGPEVQQLLKAVRSGDWSRRPDGVLVVGQRGLADDEYTLRLVPVDESVGRSLPGEEGLVVLDLATTPELDAEGVARDVIRLVQETRKKAGLHVSDRIRLVLGVTPRVRAAVEANAGHVQEQTLSLGLTFATKPEGEFLERHDLDDEPVVIALTRAG